MNTQIIHVHEIMIHSQFHHPMSEHRIQLDTLDARWGRYRALISRSDQLQRKGVMTPSSVIAVIGHPLSIRPHTPALSLMCVSINRFDVHVHRACLCVLNREFNRD